MAIVQSDGVLSQSPASLGAGYIGSTPTGLTWYNGRSQDYAALFRQQPNLRLVISFLAPNMAQLGIDAFKRVSSTVRESLGDHPIGELLRFPNPPLRLTQFAWLERMASDYFLYDEAFSLKTRNDLGELRLWPIPPYLLEPVDGNIWQATKWRFLGVRSQPIFATEDFVMIHGYNPADMTRGLSPIESLRRILAEDQAAGEYREQFWNRGARMSGIIERPIEAPAYSPQARDRFMRDWNASFSGDSLMAGTTPMLEEGMHYQQLSFSAKDSEYLGARRLTREEVAAQYHLSPLFVGILENANFSNVKEQHKHLYQDCLGPPLVRFQQALQLCLVPEFIDLDIRNTYFEFDLLEKLKGSFEEEAAAAQASVGRPWRTVNEQRARQNDPPLDGGDDLVTPLNVLIGGQASPTDSAPPITASRPAKALAVPHTKAVDELADDVTEWFDAHKEKVVAHFERQGNSVVAALQAGQSIESIFGQARWNRELKADFLTLASEMSAELGTAAADAFDGGFDIEAAGIATYLDINARIAAESVNSTTQAQLEALDPGDDFIDGARNIFDVGAASRAEQIAVSRVTAVGNFARREGAKQGGAANKVWRVHSSNSRHPRLNGEKVAIDDDFSNGARWPGDHSLNEDQRAGCVCSLDFERD